MEQIESTTSDGRRILRNTVSVVPLPPLFCLLNSFQVALREQHRCAITKAFDSAQAEKLIREERIEEIPEGVGQHLMEVAHIVPFLLNGFGGDVITSPQIVRDVLSFLRLIHLRNRKTLLGL
jgi:hypothetical protein